MPSINRCTIAGHLGREPETKTFANGGSVCNFSIATSEKWKDRDGNPKERTDWHNIVCHGKTGELAQQYLSKGAAVLIEGAIRQRQYEKDGQTKYVTEIHADRLHFLSRGEKSEQPARPAQRASEPADSGGRDFSDNDIPFAKRNNKEW